MAVKNFWSSYLKWRLAPLLAVAERIRVNIQNISRETEEIEATTSETPLTVSIDISAITETEGEKDLVITRLYK